ncbi:MAG: 2-dehydropantoate 2-reductase [Balneolaceae bacterium]
MNTFDFKNIMVMGAGGVGGYFGGKLTLNSSRKISLVARGEHLKAIKKQGLVVESIDGDFVVEGPASENPVDLPRPDLILFTVKSYDTDHAIEQIKSVVSETTQILPLQNGIENIPKLVEAFGDERVMYGLCRIGIRISEPGKLSHTNPGSVILGEKDGRRSERIEWIKNIYDEVGVECKISTNIRREIWKKFSWNSIFNMITAAENQTTDHLYENGKPKPRLRKLANEILKVAKAEGVNLHEEDLEKMVVKTQNIGAFITSTLNDRRVGKKMEFDAFTGAILRLGEKHSIELPEYQKLHKDLQKADIS